MKKSILGFLSLAFIFILNANAAAYHWKATKIEGVLEYQGNFYGPYTEELINGKYTTFNWFGNFVQGYQEYVYGENYYGNSVWVEVYGMPQDEPKLKLGINMVLLKM